MWREAFGITLAPFQEWLLRRIMEVYPVGHERAGELRLRQCVISVARQNSKSDIAAIVGLWGLLRKPNSITIGIASSADLANIVYSRAVKAINANPSLKARFARLTGTRGIETKSGATYSIKASKSAALQGQAIHSGILDELHLIKPELWADMVNGTGARLNTIIVGITTAGSENSELLKSLYETGMRAVEGDSSLERFGFFCWEAPLAEVPDDDGELLKLLIPANPLLASGLIDPAAFISDVRGAGGKAEIVRYRLNRFYSSTDSFIDMSAWAACQRPLDEKFPMGASPLIVCVDISPDQNFVSWSVATQVDGMTHVKLAATLPRPTLETMSRVSIELAQWAPVTYAMDSRNLGHLAADLKGKGYPVTLLGLGDATNGAAHFYGLVMRRKIRHGGEPLLSVQLPQTMRKDKGDGRFRINPKASGADIEAVCSIVGAAWIAETTGTQTLQGVF